MTLTIKRRPASWAMAALLGAALLSPSTARAESGDRKVASFASGSGSIIFLAVGLGLPLLRDGGQGKSNAFRVADSLGTTLILTEGLKALTKEKRPDSSDHDSFPSGHTSAAFAVAAMESQFHPKEAPLWYLGAATIGWSRLRLNRHHPQDVAFGALLGFGVSRWEVSRPHGIILTPYIDPENRSMRVEFNRAF